jgi:RNA polymerase sigma-70 factor (ECF subfamily)
MADNDDDDVMRFFQNGDQQAFDQLFDRYHKLLVRQVYMKFGDIHFAEDAAMETWHAVLATRSRQPVSDATHFWNLLKRIANQRAIDGWRRHKREQEWPRGDQQGTPFDIPADDADPIVKRIQHDELAGLSAAIGRLKPPHRVVVVMYYLEDVPVDSIATDFNVSEGTVYRWLHEARQELLRFLADGEQGLR